VNDSPAILAGKKLTEALENLLGKADAEGKRGRFSTNEEKNSRFSSADARN